MDEKQIQALYDAMNSKLNLGSYQDFKSKLLSDDNFRKSFHDEASQDLELGDYNSFSNNLKKKEGGVSSVPTTNISAPSSPTQSPSQSSSNVGSPANNFGMKNFSELAKANQSAPENTQVSTQPQVQGQVGFQKAADAKKQQQQQNRQTQAIDNATQRSLKSKGLNAAPGSLLYNIERSGLANQVDRGDATVTEKNGELGLNKTTDWLESAKIGYNNITKAKDDAEQFTHNMTTDQMVESLKKEQEQQNNSAYLGTRPSTMGSLTEAAMEQAPFVGRALLAAGAGAGIEMAFPEASGYAIPKIFAFLSNAKDMENMGAAEQIKQSFFDLKHQHPYWSDNQTMEEAKKTGDIGKMAGLAQNYFMTSAGGEVVNNAAANVAKDYLGTALKTSTDIAKGMAGVKGAQELATQKESGKSNAEIFGDMADEGGHTFLQMAAFNALTDAAAGIARGVPKLAVAASKNLFATQDPVILKSALDESVQNGHITPEQAEKVESGVANFAAIKQTLPDGLSEESKVSIAGLTEKKQGIQAEAKTKDQSKAIQEPYKQQIEAIDNQISEIVRTGKPLEHEINETTGKTYEQPTYDNIAALKVKNLADKISKGKPIEEPEDLQTEQNFPDQIETQLKAIAKEEKSGNKGKENATTELSDNVNKYLDEKNKAKTETQTPNAPTEAGTSDEGTNQNIQPAKEVSPTKEGIGSGVEKGFTSEAGNKVVDEKGKPLSVYHRTNGEFDKFDEKKKGTNTGWDNTVHGFFFADKPENTEQFGKNLIEANINLKKPIDLRYSGIFNNEEQAPVLAKIFFDEDLSPKDALEKINDEIGLGELSEMKDALNSKEAHDAIVKAGYDGIISDMGNNQNEYIVFDKDAIKIKSKNGEPIAEPKPIESAPIEKGIGSGVDENKWNVGDVIPADPPFKESKIKSIIKETGSGIKVELENGSKTMLPMDKKGFLSQFNQGDKEDNIANEEKHATSLKDVLNNHENSENATDQDLVRAVESHIEDNPNDKLQKEIDKYWKADKESKEKYGDRMNLRGEAFDNFQKVLNKEIEKEPTESAPIKEPIEHKPEEKVAEEKPPIPPETPKQEVKKEEPPEGGKVSGIAQRVREKRAEALNTDPAEKGKGWSPEQAIAAGKDLVENQGIKPEDVLKDFEKDELINGKRMAVVNYEANRLAKLTESAGDKFGEDSKQFKDAKAEENDFLKRSKPMQTEWNKAGTAQQGETDIRTGSFTALKTAFKGASGKEELSPDEERVAKKLSDDVKARDTEIEKLKSDLKDAWNKVKEVQTKADKATFTEKAKKIAENFRKLKTKPFVFKDKEGNEIPIEKMGVGFSWNDMVELGAKAIEKTGEIADGVAAIIEKIKDSDRWKSFDDDQKKDFEKQLTTHYEGSVKETSENKTNDLIEKLDKYNPKQTSFTPEEAKGVWDHITKNYLDKGVNIGDAVSKTSDDLGITENQVMHAIAQPKGAKAITDEMWRKNYQRRLADAKAKAWVKSAGSNQTWRNLTNLANLPGAIATAYHGPVVVMTHAGMDLYRPKNIKNFIELEGNGWANAFGDKAKYEQKMNALVKDPTFPMWKKAKLVVDPNSTHGDDFTYWSKLLKKWGENGIRAFNAIKMYRLQQANMILDKVNPEWKYNKDGSINEDVLKTIAEHVNLSTGTTKLSFGDIGDAAARVLFAPKLVASQIQRILTEPTKALGNTALWMWGNAKPEQKLQAKLVWSKMGTQMATYGLLLASNAAILKLTGSNQSINYKDPTKEDWLKIKGFGWEMNATAGTLPLLRFFVIMGIYAKHASWDDEMQRKEKPGEEEGKKLTTLLRGKESPAAQVVSDYMSGTDVMGRPTPWSNVPLQAWQRREGITKHTWGSYIGTKMPIFIADGFQAAEESAMKNGMPKTQFQDIVKGIFSGIEAGTFGARVNPDYSLEKSGSGGGGGSQSNIPTLKSQPSIPTIK